MDFFEVLKNRHSVREFQEREIEEEKLRQILEAANSAPSAGNLQAYKIFVVKDLAIKEQLVEAALNQDFITQAPVVLVFVANPERSARKYGQRGSHLYCLQDATIAASFAWLAAVDLGLTSVWVGAFDGEEVQKILNLPVSWYPVAILPIGYPAEELEKTLRRPLDDIAHCI